MGNTHKERKPVDKSLRDYKKKKTDEQEEYEETILREELGELQPSTGRRDNDRTK